jgi:MoxR-like ATPase
VIDLVADVLRHRVTLTYEALADGMTPDAFVERIVKAVPAPAKPLRAAVNA